MTDQSKKKATVVAGVAGAVVGAGVAVAATKVMSDNKMRDKVTETFNDFKNQVIDILDESAQQNQISQKGGSASRQLKDSHKSQGKRSNSHLKTENLSSNDGPKAAM